MITLELRNKNIDMRVSKVKDHIELGLRDNLSGEIVQMELGVFELLIIEEYIDDLMLDQDFGEVLDG